MGLDLAGAPDVAEREEQGVTVTLIDDTGEAMMEGGLPVTMTVVGTYSKTYRTAKAATERKFQKTIRRQGHVGRVADRHLSEVRHRLGRGA